MDGRWIVANVGRGVEVRSITGGKACAPEGITPVVPCDDAAIERVAEKLHDLWGAGRWVHVSETERPAWLSEARDLLAAAGETDR